MTEASFSDSLMILAEEPEKGVSHLACDFFFFFVEFIFLSSSLLSCFPLPRPPNKPLVSEAVFAGQTVGMDLNC